MSPASTVLSPVQTLIISFLDVFTVSRHESCESSILTVSFYRLRLVTGIKNLGWMNSWVDKEEGSILLLVHNCSSHSLYLDCCFLSSSLLYCFQNLVKILSSTESPPWIIKCIYSQLHTDFFFILASTTFYRTSHFMCYLSTADHQLSENILVHLCISSTTISWVHNEQMDEWSQRTLLFSLSPRKALYR